MGEAKRRRQAPRRACPVNKALCFASACQKPNHCQRTERPKGEPWTMPGQFGHAARKDPCRECPLRRDSAAGYLGGYSVENYLHILHGDADIACHMSPGFHERDLSQQRSCTGVAAYRANVAKIPRGPHAAESVRLVGPDRERFFATPAEFAAHHGDRK